MERELFYQVFFNNIGFFCVFLILVPLILYFIVNKISVTRNYLDPAHFYITFTLGTAYAIVCGLYFLDIINFLKFSLIIGYGILFLISLAIFSRARGDLFYRAFSTLLVPKGTGKFEFKIAFIAYVICATIVVAFVGFGFFAETNRFQQNKGFGVFVRVLDGMRLFIISYLTIIIYKKKTSGTNRVTIYIFLMFFCLFSSVLNGAKFALLESVYAVLLTLFFVRGKLKIGFVRVTVIFSVILAFALGAYAINISNNGLSAVQSKYIPGVPYVFEALFLRVLANADKYFLSLPNNVIDLIQTKPSLYLFMSPIIGSGTTTGLLGYNVSDFSIGKQILLYWMPGFDIAGGPTSHFDLFAYVNFGVIGGLVWVIITGLILGSITKLRRHVIDNDFSIALLVVLWLRSLALILEPPLGIAYIFDVFLMFTLIKLFSLILRKVSR